MNYILFTTLDNISISVWGVNVDSAWNGNCSRNLLMRVFESPLRVFYI